MIQGMIVFLAIIVIVVIVIIAIKTKINTISNYKNGQYNLNPSGSLIIAGRLKTTGQWIELEKIINTCETKKDGKINNVIYEYTNEGAWMQYAATVASQHFNPIYQDIMIYYYNIDFDVHHHVYYQKINLWLNGKWISK